MKMSFLAVIIGLLTIFCVCNSAQAQQQAGTYTVKGELSDSSANGKTAYIMRYDDNKNIDSTLVEGNKITFTGKVDTASFCRIVIKNNKEFANLILESGNIHVNFKKYNQPSGTKQNNEIAKIAIEEDSIDVAMNRKREEYQKQYIDKKEFNVHWKDFVDECRKGWNDRCIELYKEHNNDAVGFFLLYSLYMGAIDFNVQEAVIGNFGSWLKSRNRVQDMIVRIEALKKTVEGQPFTDIKGKDENGNPIALSDFVGKGNYVLMDMWASWCGPCKREIPNLAELYNKFKDKGLTVLGMFVWDKEENLNKAVKAEKVTWPQIFDSGKMAMKLYGVNGIPHIILFAPDGTILKRNLRGDNMVQTVTEIMTNK